MSAGSRVVLGIALALGASRATTAQASDELLGAPDAFAARLIALRTDPAVDRWYRTIGSAITPQLAAVDRVYVDEPFTLLLFMGGIGDVGEGVGRVSMDLSATTSDGDHNVMAEDVPVWDAALPPADVWVLAPQVMGLSMDAATPLGRVTFHAEVTDHASGSTVSVDAVVGLAPWSYGDQPADQAAYETWLNEYHRAPRPDQAVRAYLEFAQLEDAENGSWEYLTIGFFRAVFEDAPWLLTRLVEQGRDRGDEVDFKVTVLLGVLGELDRLDWSEAQVDAFGELLGEGFADPYAGSLHPAALDGLWGEFAATGRYAPIRRIASALTFAPLAETFRSRGADAGLGPDDLIKATTASAAAWSLGLHMREHPLVLAYCQHMLVQEPLGDDERHALEALVRGAAEDEGR